jgi:hypothetical protein
VVARHAHRERRWRDCRLLLKPLPNAKQARRPQDDGYSHEIRQTYYPRFVNALSLARNVHISSARERKQCSVSEIQTPI